MTALRGVPVREALDSAVIALSASENATSESPFATSSRLSTDAEVVSAVVGESGSSSLSRSASPPP